jgi:hypothetical protein
LKKLNWCRIVRIQGKGREGFARDLGKKRENLKFECFPANPSQILPTFCHGTKVKPLKIGEKKNYQIYRSIDRKEGRKKLFCKEIAKKWRNLKI